MNIDISAKNHPLEPIVKWAGGKDKELKYILPNLPKKYNNFYDPFVGGGSVFMAVPSNKSFINDRSVELIDLYKIIISDHRDDFFYALDDINHNWDIISQITLRNKEFFFNLYKDFSQNNITESNLANRLYEFILKHADEFNGMFLTVFNFNIENFIIEIKKNLIRKIKRMKELENKKGKLPKSDILDNIETSLKSAFYMHFRHIYNEQENYSLNEAFTSAIFLFIRNYAYSGMFRYNSMGKFNVPYGGIGYNNKNFRKKVEYLKSNILREHLKKAVIENDDFEAFLNKYPPKKDDFIFLDPPYDSTFSTYAQNKFDKFDQERLATYLITRTKAKWMLIIKNTDFIYNLYSKANLEIDSFDKTYLVSFMNRNDKDVEHLLIRNYK